MVDNAVIRERLEYLKNYTYEELNSLKSKILNEGLYYENTPSTGTGMESLANGNNIVEGYLKAYDNQTKRQRFLHKRDRNIVHRKYRFNRK